MRISRLELQAKLEEILGSSNVYYQAPPNTGMKYPCIVYSFEELQVDKADNKPYILTGNWTIHHMFKNIKNDTIMEKMINSFLCCSHDRRIVNDGVYNDYYSLNE